MTSRLPAPVWRDYEVDATTQSKHRDTYSRTTLLSAPADLVQAMTDVRRSLHHALALTALGCVAANADETDSIPPSQSLRFEISPFIGYGLGGGFKLSDTGQSVNIRDHASFALALDGRA